MKAIGGNIVAELQIKDRFTKNAIGEKIQNWKPVNTLTGFLDYQAGDSQYQNYSSKIQESTHVFICDYVELDSAVKAENSRMIIKDERYDVLLIDDPMELHYQLEIYLKYTGGQ
jgi:hypothetical protein